MIKNIYLLLTLFSIALLSSCSKDDNTNFELLEKWKLENLQAIDNLDKSIYKSIDTSNGTVYYKVLTKGEGKKLDANSRVSTYYRGYFFDQIAKRIAFDGNVSDKWEPLPDSKPLKVALSTTVINSEYIQVIDGWTYALREMSVGDKWEVWIPYNLAYGPYGIPGAIPGYSTLAFEIEVLDVAE